MYRHGGALHSPPGFLRSLIMDAANYCFPVFKGLQKPLEFMGLRGRFMVLAAAGVGVSFLGYCIGAFCFGQMAGIIACLVLAGASLGYIFIKQKQGLHSKKRGKDILVYHYLYIRK